MNDVVVGWLLLIEEMKLENPGSLVMVTVFVRTISLIARNQRYRLIQIMFHKYQPSLQERGALVWLVLDLNGPNGETRERSIKTEHIKS